MSLKAFSWELDVCAGVPPHPRADHELQSLSHCYTKVAKGFALLFWEFQPSFSSSHPLQLSWRENFPTWGLPIMSLQLHKTAKSLLIFPSTRSSSLIRRRLDFQLLLISRTWVNWFPLGKVRLQKVSSLLHGSSLWNFITFFPSCFSNYVMPLSRQFLYFI